MLPGQITTDTLISSDGKSFLKFLANQFKFGNEDSGIDWNVSQQDQLSIRNATIETRNKSNEIVARIDGETGAAQFCKGKALFNADGSGAMGQNRGNGAPLIQWNENSSRIGSFDFHSGFLKYQGDKVNITFGERIFPAQVSTEGILSLIHKGELDSIGRSVLYIDSEGDQLMPLLGGLANRALHINRGGIRVEPNNYIDMPGLVLAGRVSGAGGIEYQWGIKGRRGLNANYAYGVTVSDNVYTIHHLLRHHNYSVVVTPIETGDWKKYHSIVTSIGADTFSVVFVDSGTDNRYVNPTQFSFAVFGENSNL